MSLPAVREHVYSYAETARRLHERYDRIGLFAGFSLGVSLTSLAFQVARWLDR